MSLKVRIFCCILLILGLPFAAIAQSNDTDLAPETEAPADAGTEAPATAGAEAPEEGGGPLPGSDLAIGTPANPDGIGRSYVKETFGDWEMRCIRTQDGNDPCQLYQLLLDENDTSVAEINLFAVSGNPNIVAGATVVTPLETLLTADLRMVVDDGEVQVYPFAFCREIGCFSRLGLTDADITAFKAGSVANVIIVPAAAPDQTVDLRASLSGFTAAWNTIAALNEEQAADQ